MEFVSLPGSIPSLADAAQIGPLGPILVALIAVLLLKVLRPTRRARGRAFCGREQPAVAEPVSGSLSGISDPARQLEYVARVSFETVPLLNREEATVFALLETVMAGQRDGYRLMAQTSLGEVIRPSQGRASAEDRHLAFRSINSKRLDFAIFDQSGRLALAIEYQGSGHYRETSFMRDAVKKETLRKAGVPLLEIPERYHADDIARQVRRALCGPGSRPGAQMGETGQDHGEEVSRRSLAGQAP